MDAVSQADLSKLSEYDKRELQQNLQNEMQKAKIQECMPLAFTSTLVCPNAPYPQSFHILPSILGSLVADADSLVL
jgi:hypothetical protein